MGVQLPDRYGRDEGRKAENCPSCGRKWVEMEEGVERILLTTASGSRYAVWHRDQIWWVRPRVTASPTARPRSDAWVRSTRPRPWPCRLGHPIALLLHAREFRDGELVGGATDWRSTTPIVEIATWLAADQWPGEPPTEEAQPTAGDDSVG